MSFWLKQQLFTADTGYWRRCVHQSYTHYDNVATDTIMIHELPTQAVAHSTSSSDTYFPHEVIFIFLFLSSSPRKRARVLLLSPQCPRKATTQTAAAISGPSCRHVCSAAYLFKPAAGPGGPAQASPGASPACLRIHSHLRIKLLTLMLLVMLGPAPIFEPINLLELGNIGHISEKEKCHEGRIQTWYRGCFVR